MAQMPLLYTEQNLYLTDMTNTSALYLAIRIENVNIVRMIVKIDHNWNEYDSVFVEKISFYKSCLLKAIEI